MCGQEVSPSTCPWGLLILPPSFLITESSFWLKDSGLGCLLFLCHHGCAGGLGLDTKGYEVKKQLLFVPTKLGREQSL